MNIKIKILLATILFLTITTAIFSDSARQPLLRDGLILVGTNGAIIEEANLPDPKRPLLHPSLKHSFRFDSETKRPGVSIEKGTTIPLLPSAGLQKMLTAAENHPENKFRLYRAIVTNFNRCNYLYVDHFLPLTEKSGQQTSQKPEEALPPINEPNDVLKVPQEVLEKLKNRTDIRSAPLKEGQLGGDFLLTDGTGIIKQNKDGNWLFQIDSLGRNVTEISFYLLPCEALQTAICRLESQQDSIRFKASGIITRFKGRYYLLLNRATRTYSYGNFAK